MPVREVAFELECFEWADERLEVAGRWKGLSGRRLARPVLTVDTGAGRKRRLVALPGGQLAAGSESWRAAFSWPGDPADITSAELEIGGNVVVDLPLPDRRRRRRKRAAAEPSDEPLRAEVTALRGQVERLRSELAARERENMQLRAQVEEPGDAEDGERSESSDATVEIQRIADEREQELTAELDRLAAERDSARGQLSAELERLESERERLVSEQERIEGERARLATEVDDLREAFADAAAEAESTRESHSAELARLEDELRGERATIARLTAELADRHELPPPATRSARGVAAAPPTEALRLPDADEPAPEPEPASASADADGSSALVEAASLPGALDAPGPIRAGTRPATQPGESRVGAWLRARRGEDAGDAPAEAAAAGPSAAAFAAGLPAAPGSESREHEHPGGAALRALRDRMERLFVPNGHTAAEREETAPAEPAVPRPRRTATAARARAGATVAARRSPAELWALRALAAVLVAVLLIAMILILAHIA
jgi:predicted  nucleic acid-binding Zn-ribbon protein